MDYWPLYVKLLLWLSWGSGLPPHNSKIIYGGSMTRGVVVVIYWEGTFWCSLNLSANVLADSPIYTSSHSTLSHLYLYMTPLFLRIGSLSFGAMRRFLMVSPPLKCTCMPYFLHDLLKLSLSQPSIYTWLAQLVGCLFLRKIWIYRFNKRIIWVL